MTLRGLIKLGVIVFAVVGFWMAYYDFAYADAVSNPYSSGGDPEAKLGSTFREVVNFILFVAMGLGGITFAWGLAEYNGLIGEKKEGVDKMKRGGVVLAVAGVAVAVIAFFAGLSA